MSAGGGDGGDGGGTDGVKWNECVVLCGVCAGEEGFTQVMFHDADILMCECVGEGTVCDSESTGHGGECGSESGESTKGWCQRDTSFTEIFLHRRNRVFVGRCEEVTVQGWSGRIAPGFNRCYCVVDCGVVMRRMMMVEGMVVDCMRNKNVGDIPLG